MSLFDQDWLDQAAKELGNSVGLPSEPLVVTTTVVGGPDGDVTATWRVTASGTDVAVESASDAAVGFSCSHKDAIAIVEGILAPAVAFMQGRLKTTGDNGVVIRLLEVASTSGFAELSERLRLIPH